MTMGYDSSKPLLQAINAPKIGERLTAWDPVGQREVWSVPHKSPWNGGVLTTATGLVFEGTSDGKFIAFDADDGKMLWQKDLGTGIIGSPVTYLVGDTQYVSIAVGWGGAMGMSNKFTEQINPGTVYTFAINKNAAMPVYAKQGGRKLIDITFTATTEQVQHGGLLFVQYCASCHGGIGGGGGVTPDLGYSSEATHKAFTNIVLRGLLEKKGMPNFSGKLTESNITDIHNYSLATTQEIKKRQTNKKPALASN
jgi:quinohemoprotein ethanol dehydrogenase